MGTLLVPKRHALTWLAILACVAFSACNKITDPSNNRTESFSGTLNVQEAQLVANFSVPNTGEFEVTITALSRNVALGLSFGQAQSDGSCAELRRNIGQLSLPALGGNIQKGNWCVVVFDPGSLTSSINYTIQISHP